ncbi:AAA family ATPase, partial [Paenibacillus sp. P46E]|uniref:AAA family ATPase n=1 Tax=Paenibacillus sp. P46E TaxID=1349436 RepID=UPI0015BAEA65
MKINWIYIYSYKNIINQKIEFDTSKSNVTVVVGKNGSGKSNLLESISLIFSSLYNTSNNDGFMYSIQYEIDGHVVEVEKLSELKILVDGQERTVTYLNNNDLLPTNVIAVYSGEELRLWKRIFSPFYNAYIKSLLSGSVSANSLKLMYINKFYWDIAFLTLLISEMPDNKGFVANFLGINHVDTIEFEYDVININKNAEPKLQQFLDKIKNKNHYKLDELRDILKSIIYSAADYES